MPHLIVTRLPPGDARDLTLGQVFPLHAHRTYLGRDADPPYGEDRSRVSHLRLLNRRVNHYHALIRPAAAGLVIRDLFSRSGTLLNGVRLGDEDVPLREGDRIQIVDFEFVFHDGPDPDGGHS